MTRPLRAGRAEVAVGLICDNDLARHSLQQLLLEADYQLPLVLTTARVLAQPPLVAKAGVSCWLLAADARQTGVVLDVLAEAEELPLLVLDEPPPPGTTEFSGWCRRVLEKLALYTVPPSAGATMAANLQQVWLLAASMGGPEAVKRFVAALPPGLPLAMVYAQHIDAQFDALLPQAFAGQQAYPLQLVSGQDTLQPGRVSVVPADRQLRFLPHGRMVAIDQPWTGPYQPAIDQVVAELARIYRQRFGVIVFSGMCNDAEIGCRVARACGSQVWVQSPATCACPAMPEAVLASGAVAVQGSPEQLAAALTDYLQPESAPLPK